MNKIICEFCLGQMNGLRISEIRTAIGCHLNLQLCHRLCMDVWSPILSSLRSWVCVTGFQIAVKGFWAGGEQHWVD